MFKIKLFKNRESIRGEHFSINSIKQKYHEGEYFFFRFINRRMFGFGMIKNKNG